MNHHRHTAPSLLGPVAIIIVVALAGYFVLTRVPLAPSANPNAPVTFYCNGGSAMQATFATSSVALVLSDGRSFTLPQTMSGSGIRYEATSTDSGTDIAFIAKGANAFLTENGQETYAQCTAARIAPKAQGEESYTDLGNTFSFAFPSSFMPEGSDPGLSYSWTAPATTTGEVLAKIYVPQSFMPGTNFGDAWFTVGDSSDPSAVATCLSNLSGSAATTTVSINGTSFTKLEFQGAAAGNRYDTTSYRMVKDGMCYAVEYTIHYGVLENYPKGAVQAFDEQKIADALDQVAQSFRFLPQ